MRRFACILFVALASPAAAQEAPAEAAAANAPLAESFVEAAQVCLTTLLNDTPLTQSPDAMTRVRPASQETRAMHPFGADPNLLELASRTDGQVTLRAPDRLNCSVFAVGAHPADAFEAFAQIVSQRADFTEQDVRSRHEGRVQRSFRSNDGRTRIELEGFTGGVEASPNASDLSMAHFARRR